MFLEIHRVPEDPEVRLALRDHQGQQESQEPVDREVLRDPEEPQDKREPVVRTDPTDHPVKLVSKHREVDRCRIRVKS